VTAIDPWTLGEYPPVESNCCSVNLPSVAIAKKFHVKENNQKPPTSLELAFNGGHEKKKQCQNCFH
jgi:hypothetical protein